MRLHIVAVWAIATFATIASAGASASLFSSVLPTSRSGQVGTPVTFFATVINSSTTPASGCRILLNSAIPASVLYQETDPATNAVVGAPNTPVTIDGGGFATFVITMTALSEVSPTDVAFSYVCDDTPEAITIAGVNTLLFSASDQPVADIIALIATPSNDGIVNVPLTGFGFFSMASVNVGTAATVTVRPRITGAAADSLLVCETEPSTGICLADPAPSAVTTIDTQATPTFAVFVASSALIELDPARFRVFVEFLQGSVVRGSSSVAVRTTQGAGTAPSITGFSPANDETDVDLDAAIEVTFSRDIDPNSFNSSTVSVTSPAGVVTGSYTVSANRGFFTPERGLQDIAGHVVTVTTGVRALDGTNLANESTARFYTQPDPEAWYALSNLFMGPSVRLTIVDDAGTPSACQMLDSEQTWWQFRVTTSGGYFLQNSSYGNRLALTAPAFDAACGMVGVDGLDLPAIPLPFDDGIFSKQIWDLVPTNQEGYFKLLPRHWSDGALDGDFVVQEGSFSGQFWRLARFSTPFQAELIGTSSGGDLFDIQCAGDDRVKLLDTRAGDDIDYLSARCQPYLEGSSNLDDSELQLIGPDKVQALREYFYDPVATMEAGSTGNPTGGSPGALACPEGAIMQGLTGSARGNGVVDQLQAVCRAAGSSSTFPFGPVQGAAQGSNPFVDSICPDSRQFMGLQGFSGTLIDRVGARCKLPPTTGSRTFGFGGSGGEPFSQMCPWGTRGVGLRGRVGDDIDQLRLVCANDANDLSDAGSAGGAGGTDFGEQQVCAADRVLVGVDVDIRNSPVVIDRLNVRCADPTGSVFSASPIGVNNDASSLGPGSCPEPCIQMTCPSGMFVSGISGSAGDLIDSLRVHCSTKVR